MNCSHSVIRGNSMVVSCERRLDHRHPIFWIPHNEVSNNPVFVQRKAFVTNLKPVFASEACTPIYDGLLDKICSASVSTIIAL